MSFTVFTYGNGVMLTSLFQAVAALTSTDDYLKLLQLILILNIPVILTEIIFTGRFKPTARMFIILLIVNVAVLPKATINLVDRVDPTNNTTIANVPAGLAVPLSYTTAIGDWGTQAFETIFAMPNSLRYQNNGLLFASRLVAGSTDFEITDSRMQQNMAEFSKGCIYYGILVGWFTMDTITDGGDIWTALPAAKFGNAIFVNYNDGTNTTLKGCKWTRTKLENDWTAELDRMQKTYGQRYFPNAADAATAKALLVSALPQAYTFMTSISTSAANLIRQNAMISILKRSFSSVANEAGATAAAQDFALAQAEAQQRSTYSTLGAMAGRTLALMSNVLETLIYGAFPLAIIFMLFALMQGKAIFTYLKLLIWLQLWPPLYAILNYAMSTYGASQATAAALLPGGGKALTMMTVSGISAVNADMSAMAGYLTWMVPMFSWAIVSGGGFAASQMASSIGSVAQSAGSTAAGQVATGNLSLGNVGYGNTQLKNFTGANTSMFKTDMNPTMNKGVGSATNPMTGATQLSTAGGMQFSQQPVTSMPFSANLASALRSSVATTAGQMKQAQISAQNGFSASTASSFGNMSKLNSMADKSISIGNGAEYGSAAQFKSNYNELGKILDGFDFSQDLTRQQKATAMANASLGLRVAGSGANAEVSVGGVSMSGSKWAALQKYAKESGFQKVWDATQQSGTKFATQHSERTGDSLGKEISAGFSDQRAASRNLQATATEAQTWQQLSQQLKEGGGTGSMNATSALIQYGESKGYDMKMLGAQAASTTGDPAGATQTIQGVVSDFVQSGEVAKLANIGAAPTSGNVSAANAANQDAVQAATENPSDFSVPGSGDVKAWGAAQRGEHIDQQAAARGIPSSSDIQQQDQAIRGTVSGNLQTANDKVSGGRSDTESQGAANFEKPVTDAVNPENQNHMGAATVEMGQNISSTTANSYSGMKDVLSKSLDQMFSGGEGHSGGHSQTPDPNGRIVGGSSDGQGHYDLPPGDDTGAKSAPKAWVNHLD